MNRLIIPIEPLKRIESWLETAIGYEPVMFEEEFTEISNRLESEEETELYLNLTYKDNPALTGDFHNDALLIGKNLVIPIYPISDNKFTISQEEIKVIFDKHITSPNTQDEDAYFALLMLSAIYYKHKATTGFFGFEPGSPFEKPNPAKVRKEMLELYILFNEESKTNKKTIDIAYNNNSILLRNSENWFTDMMQSYFKEHLVINNAEQAKRELANFDPNYTDSKGKKPDTVYNSLLISVYNLIKNTSIKSDKALSDKEANFILDYLKYIGAIEEEGKRDDILNLRASIKNLQNFFSQWWNPALFS